MATGSKKLRKTKKGDSYLLTIECGRDAITGKRIRNYYTFMGTEKQAEKELQKYIAKAENGGITVNTNTLLSSWMVEWLDIYKTNISPTTRASYQEKMKNHIFPHIGSIALGKISDIHLQKWVNRLYHENGLSPKTIRNTFQILSSCLEKARKLKMIAENPCEDVQLPKRQKYKSDVYSMDEIQKVLQLTKGTPLYAVSLLGFGLGLRRGELTALTWDDVDLENNIIHIRQNMVVVNGKPELKSPKSESSIRDINISGAMQYELAMLKRKQSEDGILFTKNNYVVKRRDGLPYNPNSITQAWNRFTKRNNMKHIRLHDMRHTNATTMIEEGVSIKTVQERLGHSDISTTMNTYAHVTKGMDVTASNRLDRILFTNAITG